MNNEKQIVLFLNNNIEFSEIKLANELFDSFPELEAPITIPYDSNKPNNPLIIFNRGIMQLTMNRNDVSFIFNDEHSKECLELIEGIMDKLDDNRITFMRLGYVSTYMHSAKEKTKFLSNTFKDKNLIKDEFNLAWYKEELIDSVRVNVWERHLTDRMNNVDFISVIDINTPRDKEYNINTEFTIDFIKSCDKYISKLLDTRI